jgi:hypothetical protein
MNALVMSFFFKTQQGGFTSQTYPKSKLLPIERWLKRRLLWLCYLHETIFEVDPNVGINTTTAESDLIALVFGVED